MLNEKVDLMKYLTSNYQDGENTRKLLQTISEEMDELNYYAETLEHQKSIRNASWGLADWEEVVGLPTNINEDIELRRGKVIAKLQIRYPITLEKMKFIIESFTGSKVDIIEHFEQYGFEVKLDLSGTSDNKGVSKIINEIKPAHISWLLTFITRVINELLFESRVKFRMDNYFGRRGNILNGEWLLNGFINLDNSYEPITVRSINRMTSRNKNLFDNLKLNIRDNIKNSNEHNLRSSFLISSNFWYRKGIFLNGEWILDSNNDFNTLELHKKKDITVNIKSKMNLNVVNLEKFKSERITIKKNWWQLGGQHSLGKGSLLNAEIREEVI